jgi:thiamine transport system ATP-binding protein
VRDLLVATGTTAILVTHDLSEAQVVADRIGVMLSGRLVQTGTADAIRAFPVSSDVADFLGPAPHPLS